MNRPFIINFKNYLEVAAEKVDDLALAAEQVSAELGVEIVLAPPQPAIAAVSKRTKIPVFCQHIDNVKAGATTGFFVPELAKSYGASGSLINHSEHRLETNCITELVARLKSLQMVSVVCAGNTKEVEQYSMLEPDFVAIEPPELIGSGRAVSKENPAIITDSIRSLKSSKCQIICGAGISSKDDVKRAVELGSKGILVASSVLKAQSWHHKIYELASGMI